MKNWLTSKTIWFSFALEIFAFVELTLPQLREQLGVHYGITLLIVGVIVKALRFVTNTKLTASNKQ